MWRRTGQTMLCGGRRRRHGCSKPTGHWTSMVSKLMPGCFSHHSTSCCASSCPTWNTWRSRSTSRTASSRLCQTSAKLSVSGMIDSCIQQQVEQCYVFIRKWNKMRCERLAECYEQQCRILVHFKCCYPAEWLFLENLCQLGWPCPSFHFILNLAIWC